MSKVLLSTTSEENKEFIKDTEMLDRQLLYIRDTNNLYIRYNGQLHCLGGDAKQNAFATSDDLVFENKNNQLTLSLNPNVKAATIDLQNEQSVKWVANKCIREFDGTSNLFIIGKKTEGAEGYLDGDILYSFVDTDGVKRVICSTVHVTTDAYQAESSFESVQIVNCKHNTTNVQYIGLGLPNNQSAKLYFTGWYDVPIELQFSEYSDSDFEITSI